MTTASGLFDSFDNLDQIQPENIAYWLKNPPSLTQLENYLANRILYPQALSITIPQLQVDLAILREVLKLNGPKDFSHKANTLLGGNPFINITLRKILIPSRFLKFVPNLSDLVWAFIDALLTNRQKQDLYQDLWTVILTGDIDEVVGTIILPQFQSRNGIVEICFLNKKYKIIAGSLSTLPCLKERCGIVYRVQNGTILGKIENSMEVYGGRLGLIVDGRSI